MSRQTYSGATIAEAKAKVIAEHGTRAKIIEANKLANGGIGSFLAKTSYELIVEIPDSEPVFSGRAGILALLEDTEVAEDRHAGIQASTATNSFEAILSSVAKTTGMEGGNTAAAPTGASSAPATGLEQEPGVYVRPKLLAPAAAAPGVFFTGGNDVLVADIPDTPQPSGVAGDLILIVGRPGDALTAAKAMSRAAKTGDVRSGGLETVKTAEQIESRREALIARAAAVNRNRPVYVAYGIDASTDVAAVIAAIQPDEVWAAVDASAKHDDTRAWVSELAAAHTVRGLAVFGAAQTRTPETVNALGAPVGFIDGEPADKPKL